MCAALRIIFPIWTRSSDWKGAAVNVLNVVYRSLSSHADWNSVRVENYVVLYGRI